MSDWRDPIKPRFFEAGNVPYVSTTTEAPLVMGVEKDSLAAELLRKAEACSNCAYRMPAPPSKQNLHLFEPVSELRFPYPDEVVRHLICGERCPVCRAPVSVEVAERMRVEDRWSADATRSDRLRAEQDAELEALERREFDEGRA